MKGSSMIDKDFLKLLPYKGKMANVDREIVNGLKDAGYISELKKRYMVIPVRRYQKDIQEGQISIRLAVCYLPRDGRNDRYFKGIGKTHGGECIFEYDLAVKAPLFVKSGCGGRGYNIVARQMALNIEDVERRIINVLSCYFWNHDYNTKRQRIKELLYDYTELKYCKSNILEDILYHIIDYGQKGNILSMALREIIYFDMIRRSGYDSIICYNYTREGKVFINEVADLRTIKYPVSIHCEFTKLSDIHSKFVLKADREECFI